MKYLAAGVQGCFFAFCARIIVIREVGAAYSGHLLPGISNYNWLGGEVRGGHCIAESDTLQKSEWRDPDSFGNVP